MDLFYILKDLLEQQVNLQKELFETHLLIEQTLNMLSTMQCKTTTQMTIMETTDMQVDSIERLMRLTSRKAKLIKEIESRQLLINDIGKIINETKAFDIPMPKDSFWSEKK